MIIDIHTHTFPDEIASRAISKMEGLLAGSIGEQRAKLDGTRQGLMESTKNSSVDLSIVMPVATSPKQTDSINRFAIENNKTTEQTQLLSFGAIHPDNENYKEILDGLKAAGIKGVKLHPDYQGVMFDDIRYLRLMDYAFEKELVVLTHAGPDPAYLHDVHCSVDRIVSVLDQLQPSKLILAHMGGFWSWDEVEEKIIGREVYLDTANCFEPTIRHLSDEMFVRMVKQHGADKILFGTDSPWTDQEISVQRICRLITDETKQRMILGENAAKLLQL